MLSEACSCLSQKNFRAKNPETCQHMLLSPPTSIHIPSIDISLQDSLLGCLQNSKTCSKGLGLTAVNPLPSPGGTYRVVVSYCFDLFIVICSCQLGQPLRVQLPTVRKQLCSVLFGELSAKGVDGNNEGPPVSFKLQEMNTAHLGSSVVLRPWS